MDFILILNEFWSITMADDQDKVALISVIVAGIATIFGIMLKFKKADITKSKIDADIDEKRFNQLSEQLRTSDHSRRIIQQELDFITIERDHYKSRVRDILFKLDQIHWIFEQYNFNGRDIEWPVEDIHTIKKWAMTSPLETQQALQDTGLAVGDRRHPPPEQRSPPPRGGRRKSDSQPKIEGDQDEKTSNETE